MENDLIYCGEMQNGIPNGMGFEKSNIHKFVGFFKNGKRDGFGIFEHTQFDFYAYNFGVWDGCSIIGIEFNIDAEPPTYCDPIISIRNRKTGIWISMFRESITTYINGAKILDIRKTKSENITLETSNTLLSVECMLENGYCYTGQISDITDHYVNRPLKCNSINGLGYLKEIISGEYTGFGTVELQMGQFQNGLLNGQGYSSIYGLGEYINGKPIRTIKEENGKNFTIEEHIFETISDSRTANLSLFINENENEILIFNGFYYPISRYPILDNLELIELRENIWKFKNGFNIMWAEEKLIQLIDKFMTGLSSPMENFTICSIPASTSIKTQKRYKNLIKTIALKYKFNNGYDYIKNKIDRPAQHLSDFHFMAEEHIELNESVIGKTILLFDDVYTTGSTFRQVKDMLLINGANQVIGLFLGRTI